MLTKRPRRRIASIVPSISSLRRSTLCWCQRRLRPSVFTAPAGTCFATIADSHSLDGLHSTTYRRRFLASHLIRRRFVVGPVTVTAADLRLSPRADSARRARIVAERQRGWRMMVWWQLDSLRDPNTEPIREARGWRGG